MTERDEEKSGTNAVQGEESAEMPKVDFSTFALSLGTAALYQMGAVPDPQTGQPGEPDRLVAQQTIDTLEMLREKTQGNLDTEEKQLIDSLLYELRIKFVELTP